MKTLKQFLEHLYMKEDGEGGAPTNSVTAIPAGAMAGMGFGDGPKAEPGRYPNKKRKFPFLSASVIRRAMP